MVKCEVIEKFTLGNDKRFKFEDLIELQRKDINKDNYNTLYVGDRFICNNEMASYLTGKNPINKGVVFAIEVIPDKKEIADIIEINQGELVEAIKEVVKIEEPLNEDGTLKDLGEIKPVKPEEAKEIVKKTRGRKKKSEE